MALRLLALTALAATSALAKTDFDGCTYSDSVTSYSGRPDLAPFATRIWFVEDTGEICELLECGGGRAPPKTDVPGCGNYKGTETYSPRFLPSSTSSAPVPEETDAESGSPSGEDAPATTAAPTRSSAAGGEGASASGAPGGDDDGEQEEPGPAETEEEKPSPAETKQSGPAETGDEGASETDTVLDSGAASMGVSMMLVAGAVAMGLF